MGWTNADSFRFAEACEAGCLPLVDGLNRKVPSYFEGFFAAWGERHRVGTLQQPLWPLCTADDVPSGQPLRVLAAPPCGALVTVVHDWDEVPQWIAAQLAEPQLLERRRRALVEWWARFKGRVAGRVASRTADALGLPASGKAGAVG